MRKSLKIKNDRILIRSWAARLIGGLGVIYLIALVTLWVFRRLGGDSLLIVGFLCAFVLMPALLLALFSFPSLRKNQPLHVVALGCLGCGLPALAYGWTC